MPPNGALVAEKEPDMSYKQIDERFWKDQKVKRLSKDGYLLFLYLLTSPHTHFSGMSEMTLDYVNIDTPMTPHESKAAFKELVALGVLEYDKANKIVWIKNMYKYQVKSEQQRKGAQNHLNALPKSEICRKLAALLGLDYKHSLDTVLQIENTIQIPYCESKNTLPIQEEVKEEVKANVKAEEEKKEKELTPNKSAYSDSFENFWEAYPSKVAKSKSADSFKKALKKASADQIMNGLKVYCKTRKVLDGIVCNPTTWLNQERWNDVYANSEMVKHEPPKYDESAIYAMEEKIHKGESVDD